MRRGGFVQHTRCPKCGGNVYLENDMDGWYEECLQCGYMTELQVVKPRKELVKITAKD
jgi:ribosomal protein S27AE